MITILSKFFIKDSMNEGEKRTMYGILCGVVGIVLNLLLAGGKILAGTISGSIAITADGLNNLSDAGSSLITLLGFKLAERKPDFDHPWGYGRVEYMAGFIVAALILGMAFSLFKESIDKILHPEETVFSVLVVALLVVAILAKCYMAFYNMQVGKKINSAAITSTGLDSLTDCISTGVVLICTLLSHFAGLKIDGYCGVLVSLFVAYAGFSACKETLSPLLGQPPEKEFVEQIENIALNFSDKILGMHDLFVHDYGPGRKIITFHAEMPSDEDVLELHEIVDDLEVKLMQDLGCMATVHLDPIVVNEETMTIRHAVEKIVKSINPVFTMHDFRLVPGEGHTNMLFDVVVPIVYEHTDDEVRQQLADRIHAEIGEKYVVKVQIDKDMGTI